MLIEELHSLDEDLSFDLAQSFQDEGAVVIEEEELARSASTLVPIEGVIYDLLGVIVGGEGLPDAYNSIHFQKLIQNVGRVCSEVDFDDLKIWDKDVLVVALDGVGEGKARFFWEVPEEKDLFVFLDSRSTELQTKLSVIFKLEMVNRQTPQNCWQQAGSGFIF